MGRMRGVAERPVGLHYHPDVLSEAEERQLIENIAQIDFRKVRMHGQVARRTVRHFGLTYGYESWDLAPADPIPPYLAPVRERAAALAGLDPAAFAQTLVTCYPARVDHRLAPRRAEVRPSGRRRLARVTVRHAVPAAGRR
jgi:alkylated DNA repair protein (DNA oxidative demethylase)